MELIVLVLLIGGGVLAYRFVSADRGGADLAWSGGPGPAPGADPVTGAATTPYRSESVASPTRTAAALSRIETRRLVASPLLWVGVALTALAVLAVLDSGLPDQSEWLSLSGRFIPLLAFPLCGMVVVAANRAALRPRRDGTVELFESLPARPSTRTLALFLALRGPLLVGMGATAALTIGVWFGAGKDDAESLWSRSDLGLPFADIELANIAAAVVLVACAGALGIGLARLLPWGLVPIVAVVVVGVATGLLGRDDLPVVVSGLGPLAWGADLPAFLTPVAQGWHIVYLLGLAAVAMGVAFLMDGDRAWGGRWLGVAAVLVVVAIIGQSRTYTGGTADQIADLVTDPAAHQRCVSGPSGPSERGTSGPSGPSERGTSGESARVCSFPELDEIATAWAVLASHVRDAAPAAAVDGPVEVHVRLSPEEIGQLAAPVRAELDRRGNSFAWVDEPGLHPDLRWDGGAFQALLVGHELVGLPEPAAAPTVPCYAGGQARAAVAVALAGRGLRPGDEIRPAKFRSTPDSQYDDPSVTTLTEEDWEIDTEPAVVHSESDLTVARALLRRPVDEVRAVLADDWARWVDPDTPTSDLAAAFGLDADRPSETPEGLAPCT